MNQAGGLRFHYELLILKNYRHRNEINQSFRRLPQQDGDVVIAVFATAKFGIPSLLKSPTASVAGECPTPIGEPDASTNVSSCPHAGF
jgi:hypothetical protein